MICCCVKVTLLEFNNDKRTKVDPFYWIAYIGLDDFVVAEWTFILVPMISMGMNMRDCIKRYSGHKKESGQ